MIAADEETSKEANRDVEASETSFLLNGSDANEEDDAKKPSVSSLVKVLS